MKTQELATKNQITWCAGCLNFMILESVKRAIVNSGFKREDFVMTADIGCGSKIYDYLNISGIYGLHGRSLPIGLGVKLGNPNLKVLSFAGDGGVYSEGISHFIHAARYNADMVLIVHDNRNFSLTTGQPTATSQQGYKSKASPLGVADPPLNPLKLALACGVGFIARCDARDINHTAEILEKAIKHRGFSFVEIIQDCRVFNLEASIKDRATYKIKDNKDKKIAEKLVNEFDYNSKKGKIPLGVLYKEEKPILADKWPQLKKLMEKKVGWAEKNLAFS